MSEPQVPVLLVSLSLLVSVPVVAWRRALRQRVLERVGAAESRDIGAAPAAPRTVRPVLRRRRFIAPAIGLGVAGALMGYGHVRVITSIAFGVVVGAVAWLIEAGLASRAEIKLQQQLADSIDLMVGALGAGASVVMALGAAAGEAPRPLRGVLEDMVGRLRLGVAPREALAEVSARVPLEPFRLFTFALAVHWETGGSLTPVLATVGRSIRDRIELSRRIKSQTTEARASAITVLAIVYAIALVTWRTKPEAIESLLATAVGSALWAAAVILQAVGVLWMARLSEIET